MFQSFKRMSRTFEAISKGAPVTVSGNSTLTFNQVKNKKSVNNYITIENTICAVNSPFSSSTAVPSISASLRPPFRAKL